MNAEDPAFGSRLLSLADLTALERALTLGAPVLGQIVQALENRWRAGIQDRETLLRMWVALHHSETQPDWRSGPVDPTLPRAELVAGAGGSDRLDAETCFVLGWLGHRNDGSLIPGDPLLGDAEALVDRAAELQPESLLFAHRAWFLGNREALEAVARSRRPLLREIQARFAGRGLIALTIETPLRKAVRAAGRPARL